MNRPPRRELDVDGSSPPGAYPVPMHAYALAQAVRSGPGKRTPQSVLTVEPAGVLRVTGREGESSITWDEAIVRQETRVRIVKARRSAPP